MTNAETGRIPEEITRSTFLRRGEESTPGYVLLEIPEMNDIKDRTIKQRIGLETFMLGALADQERVYQSLKGLKPLKLKVSDFPIYPLNPGSSFPVFSVDDSTIKFLRPWTRLLTDEDNKVTNKNVENWFLRSFTLWDRFMKNQETQDLISINVGEKSFPITTKGLFSAWEASNLPKFVSPITHDTQLHIPHIY